MALAGFHADTRDIAQRFVELADRLVFELVFGDVAHALRHVDQRGRGLGRARSVLRVVIGCAFARDDNVGRQIATVGLRFLTGLCGSGNEEGSARKQGGAVVKTGHGDLAGEMGSIAAASY